MSHVPLKAGSLALVLMFTSALVCAAAGDSLVSTEKSAEAMRQLQDWLAKSRSERGPITNTSFASVPLTRADAAAAAAALWQDHARFIHATRAKELVDKVIELDGVKMKFAMLSFTNTAVTNGRSLFISMHGGGGAPHAVNESQYENQIRLGLQYRPREGIYLAPRAPTDDWNMWCKAHIDDFIDRLIEDLSVMAEVNPNRVYILGYSSGGDGVYQLAPRITDRLAAASMMAGHPNDASPLGLRNLPFSIQVGANDNGFNRNKVAAEWGKKLDDLQKADPEGYVHFTELHKGKGHWMDLEDRKAIPWMEKYTRVPLPRKVVWCQGGVTHDRFYWLAVPKGQAARGQLVTAERASQAITLSSTNVPTVIVRLNDAMLNLDEPVVIRAGATTVLQQRLPRTVATLAHTLYERGDTNLVFSAEATVNLH
jgi:predicted peptidase